MNSKRVGFLGCSLSIHLLVSTSDSQGAIAGFLLTNVETVNNSGKRIL